MPRIAITQLHDGDAIDQVFILGGKALGTTSTNKFFIKAECSNATGTIHLRMWNATRDGYDRLPATGYVNIRGRVELYQGHMQLVAESITPVEDLSKLDLSQLLKHTTKNVPEMMARVREILAGVKDKDLKAILQAFLDDAEIMEA